MAQQRQRHGGYRFSLPWLTAQTAPRRTPPQQTDVESRPAPVERQSSRLAPSQNSNQLPPSPPRAQPTKDIETQNPSPTKASPQSPSRIGTQPRPTSKTPSPSQPRVPPHPLSPSPSTRKPRVPPHPQPPSPPKVNSQTRVGPLPNSPSRTISETKPTSPTRPKIQSPTKSSSPIPPSHTILVSDEEEEGEEEAHVEKEKVVSELNPTKEYPETIISNSGDKDPTHVTRGEKTTSSSGVKPSSEGIKDDVSKFLHKMTNEHKKLPLDEAHISVITLSGENKGATMTLENEPRKKEEKINILRGYKLGSRESNDSTTEGEKSSKQEKPNGVGKQEDKEPKPCINSNIQNINNSIMFHSSITERDPGVHFSMSRTIKERVVGETKSKEPVLEANEAKSSVAVSHKLTYKPVVRRRCLKGLLMESSDSDPENPNKPHRHGCRAASVFIRELCHTL